MSQLHNVIASMQYTIVRIYAKYCACAFTERTKFLNVSWSYLIFIFFVFVYQSKYLKENLKQLSWLQNL